VPEAPPGIDREIGAAALRAQGAPLIGEFKAGNAQPFIENGNVRVISQSRNSKKVAPARRKPRTLCFRG
jgi:hypothetical protein